MNTIKKLISGMLFACGLCAFATAQETIPWCAPDTVTKVAVAGDGGIYVYTYNDRGNQLAEEYLEIAKNGTQTPQQKITSTYNRFDLVDTSISYVWRNGEYVAAARKISSYDNRGNHIFLLNENSDGTGNWTPRNRYTYTYNEHNLKTGVLVEESVDGMYDVWNNSERAEYIYDEKDREISYEQYKWNGLAWSHYRSTFNKYENDLLVEESGKGLNGEGYFKDTYRLVYTYNANGKPTEWLYLAFNDSTDAWDSAYLRKFGYYADGSDSVYISYTWNMYFHQSWDSTVKELYTNYPDGQRHTVKHYTTEGADMGEWFLAAEMEYNYNEAGRRTSYIYSDNRDEGGVFRYDFELNENNDDVRATCFKKQGEDWAPVNRYNLEVQYHDGTTILYSNAPPMHEMRVHYKSGTKTPVANETNQAWQREPDFSVRVWPNPAREILSVEAEENGYFDMALYDLSGRRLDSRRAVQRAEFNVSEYHGVYLLRVERNGAVVARKVVIL